MPSHHSHESAERAALLRRRAAADAALGPEADAPAPHPLVALGGQVGNAAVARMLAQRASDEEEEVQASHDLAQREGDEEEEVQAKPEVGLEGGPLSADLSGQINARRGGGAALDDGTRASMENGFGASFADVRVHTDAQSDALNRSISAKAFTTGSDIFFRNDTSPSDPSLLAHELTHVVQQRSMSGGGGMTVGPAGDSHEQHADAMSSAVTSGSAAASVAAQREADEAAAQRAVAQREAEEDEEQPS